MTADCLPVLFCDRAGTVVAAAHAGWRGLQGRIGGKHRRHGLRAWRILAWLGPAIGPAAFEVGGEVRDAFMAEQAEAATAFVPSLNEGKWLADIYQLARLRLARAGVTAIYGGEHCTFSDSERFYPIAATGRRVAWPPFVWLENSRRALASGRKRLFTPGDGPLAAMSCCRAGSGYRLPLRGRFPSVIAIEEKK